MDDVRLDGVTPLRRAETARRLDVIERYLAGAVDDAARREAAAGELGIGALQFANLVRTWRTHGSAVALAGSGAGRGVPRQPRRGGLPPASRDAAEQALRGLSGTATNREALDAVRRACDQRGTRVPSDSMVAYLRLNLRRAGELAPGAPGLVIGRAVAHLPIAQGRRLVLPELVLAAQASDGTVGLAAVVAGGVAHPALASAIRQLSRSEVGPVTIGIDEVNLLGREREADVVSRFTAGRALAKAIGGGFGTIRLTFGPLASLDPMRALRARADRPLSKEEAADAIRQAIAEHNAARGAPPPDFHV